MQAYTAYQKSQNLPTTRIDLILTLYRQAIDLLDRAGAALADGRRHDATPDLAKTQMIVMGLASGIPANPDEAARNCLRLFEFVSYQTTYATQEGVQAAANVLRTLAHGFERVSEQALDMEHTGKIPPLGKDHLISVTA